MKHYFASGCFFLLLLLAGSSLPVSQIRAQSGVQYVMVNFDAPPGNVIVNKSVLRYNKDFAITFHADDGFADVYTLGFQFFTGINTTGTNYPGLFYTDGCGNDIPFRLSSSVFSYSGYNNEDMHQDGNGYGAVTWTQLATMYANGCSVNNHGFTSDAFVEPDYMAYSIRRNESFIRRRLLTATPGGVKTRIFVNPNGATPYTDAAFAAGYRSTLRMGAWGVIPNEGLDVGSFSNWMQPLELNRVLAESINVKQMADQFAAAAANGQHFWMPVFTHRLVEDYPQSDFMSDFNYIAATYGKNGTDKVWMTTEEELVDYQIVRQLTTVNYAVTGNTLLMTFSGDLPTNLRHYALSLTIEAEATVSSITIIGGNNNSYQGIGSNQALINLSWEGSEADNLEALATSQVEAAEQQPTEYNCLIAMDYVLMLPAGTLRDALRDRLCALEGVTYENGFCATCSIDLGPDRDICTGSCDTLSVENVSGNSYLWSTGETTPSIVFCPSSTTDVWVKVTDAASCIAYDTLTVNLLPAMSFDLGEDRAACPGDTMSIQAPQNPDYGYQWFIDGQASNNTTSLLEFVATDTLIVKLLITNPNGCISVDSLQVFVWDQPIVLISPQSASLCTGESITLQATAQFADSYVWFDGSNQTSLLFEATTPGITQAWFRATNGFGCSATDTCLIEVHPVPEFTLNLAGNPATICAESTVTAVVTIAATTDADTVIWNGNLVVPTQGQNIIQQNFVLSETTTLSAEVISTQGCSASQSIEVQVTPLPAVAISGDNLLCEGDTLKLEATGGASCSWYQGSQLIANGYTLAYVPSSGGWFKAIVTDAGPGQCTNADSVNVSIFALPSVSIATPLQAVCSGTALTLSATGADTYVWNNGSTGSILNINPLTTTTYLVTGTSTTGGCSDTAALTIEVWPLPEVALSGLLPVYCQNDNPALLSGTPAGGLFAGGSVTNGIFDPSVAGPGNHTIVYQFTNDQGCVGTAVAETHVVAFDKSIDLGPDRSICPNESLSLDAGEGFEQYFWSTGHQSRQIELQGSAFAAGTTRSISVAATIGGCAATDAMQLTIRDDCFIGQAELANRPPFRISPNPNRGNFTLEPGYAIDSFKLQLIDLKGDVVWQAEYQDCFDKDIHLQMAIKPLKAGIYFLVISTATEHHRLKMVVE